MKPTQLTALLFAALAAVASVSAQADVRSRAEVEAEAVKAAKESAVSVDSKSKVAPVLNSTRTRAEVEAEAIKAARDSAVSVDSKSKVAPVLPCTRHLHLATREKAGPRARLFVVCAGSVEGGAPAQGQRARMAALQVVVDQAHGLHEGVHGGGADKTPAAFLQVFGQGHRFGRSGQALQAQRGDAVGAAAGGGLEAPEVGRQAAELVAQRLGTAGIVEGGGDLAAVPHDARVEQQAGDVGFAQGGHAVDVKTLESLAKALALVQDGQPAQAGLKALQADLLEQPGVVVHRKAPFRVVVALVFGGGPAPHAAQGLVVGLEQAGRGGAEIGHGEGWGGCK